MLSKIVRLSEAIKQNVHRKVLETFLKYISELCALIVKTGWYFYILELMKEITFVFVSGIDSGLFD